MIDLTDEASPPPKRARIQQTPSSNEATGEVVVVTAPAGAGPSGAGGARSEADTAGPDGQDFQVVADTTRNPGRDLPHTRENCAVHPFTAGVSVGNAAACQRCFCAVCDKPARECSQWGDGTLATHHCNRTKAGVAGPSAGPARAPSPGLGLPFGDADSCDMDDDEMDDYDRYGRGGRYGFGGYGPYGDPYDDSEDDPYGDGYGPFGYGLYRDEMPWMGGYHAGPPRKVNPWAYGNEEQGLYTFKDAKGTVMKSNTRPEPTHTLVKPKLTPYPIKEAKLNELGMRIGSINFPVKLTGVSFAQLHAELDKVPFGYHIPGANRFQDWRSWEAVFDRKHCLASIMLQQQFPDSMPGNLKAAFEKHLEKGVKAPEVPTRTVELLPFPPDPTDPQPPPVTHVLRTVLFVDCIGDIPLRVHGVPVSQNQSMSSIKEALWRQVQPGQALGCDEVLIMAKVTGNHTMSPYRDNQSIEFRDETHTYSDVAHAAPNSIYDHYTNSDSRPMVCWRVRAVPKDLAIDAAGDYSVVHYVCVSSYAATGSISPYPEPVQLAGRIPVPVLVPVKDPSTAASKRAGPIFTGFNEKSANAIAEKAAAIFSKWMTPAGKALLKECSHLARQLFCPLRAITEKAGKVGGHASSGDVRLRELGVFRFHSCNDNYRRPAVMPLYDGARHGILNVQLLWDVIPPADTGQVQLVGPEVEVERVAERLFDMAAVMAPPADASAAPTLLKQHREYIKQRAKLALFRQDQKKTPRQIMDVLLELSAAPAVAATVNNRLPAQRLFLKTVLSRAGPDRAPALAVTIWTQTLTAAPTLSVLCGWTSVRATVSRYHSEERAHPLRLALMRMLRGNPDVARMERELEAAPSSFALGTLLQRFEASKDLPEAPQPAGLTEGIKLHDYQRQSLHWMLGAERTTLRDKLWVPLGHDDLWYSPVFGKLSTGVPAGPRGGILAEEMGLGKTVEVLALALANPAPATIINGTAVKTPAGDFVQSRGTLVVCKVSLVGQWVSEARSKLSNQSLKVQEYHGGNRPRSVALLAGQDVVVTTYETLVSDMQGRSKKVKGDANPLARVKWWRIVLDESHAVKDLSSKALSAVRNVQAERRWACSGTPINTDVKDLSGQFAALHMEPLASLQFQAAYLKNGLVTSPRTIFFLLRNLMIRHSKAAVEASGAMRLPPKTEEVVHVDFRQEEWELYAKTHAAARAEFDQFASVGPSYCLTHTLSIMALLMPLRRLCSGGAFSAKPTVANVRLKQHEQIVARAAQLGAAAVAAGAVGADGAIPPAAEEPYFPAADEAECSICMDGFEAPLRTPCGHWFCSECIQQVLQQRNSCPLCRQGPISRAHLRAAVFPEPTPEPEPEPEPKPEAEAEEASTSDGRSARRALAQVQVDSKINELVAQLTRMHAADKSNKALIFTQYNDTIRYLGDKLRAAGFAYRTISGSMPMKQRAAAIEAFQRDPPTTVFILSVRSGAVGINLTSANFIFMMEPLMNPALDEQAVGRAWRMGQKRPVTVKRLIMRGTLEDSISTLAKGRKDAPPAPRNNKLGSNQAGALRADKANLKFDEMNTLFAAPTIPAEVRARFEEGE